jgi:hypothetical protein
MGFGLYQDRKPSRNSVPLVVWFGARAMAVLVGAIILYALWHLQPSKASIEPPTIEGVRVARVETARPRPETQPPAITKPEPETDVPQIARAEPPLVAANPQRQPNVAIDRPTPQVVPSARPQSTGSNLATPPPRIANGSGNPSPTQAIASSLPGQGGAAPKLGNNTLAIVRARECARLDIRDRPADCPPNEELARLLAQERGPKYRPENAEAFSRNELAWRGVPPPCLDDGENAALKGTKLCIRFGNTPSRVRSPREICLARGLGGCEAVPDQRDVDSAIAQVKARKP